jgi:hypothetical protein
MKQLLSIILVILFAFPAWAQEGVITEIQKGKRAPFTGVLLDAKAAAKVLTDQKYTAEECKSQERLAQILEIKNEEIGRLQDLALDSPNDYTLWWLTGGVVGGIILTTSIFVVAMGTTR